MAEELLGFAKRTRDRLTQNVIAQQSALPGPSSSVLMSVKRAKKVDGLSNEVTVSGSDYHFTADGDEDIPGPDNDDILGLDNDDEIWKQFDNIELSSDETEDEKEEEEEEVEDDNVPEETEPEAD